MQCEDLSLHGVRSGVGKDLHGIRGLLKLEIKNICNQWIGSFKLVTLSIILTQSQYTYVNEFGRSITFFCIIVIASEFWQTINASELFLISASCLTLKRINGSSVSNQCLSHLRSLENCSAIMQPNVGPTDPPCSGLSVMPPLNRSMSSTCLFKIRIRLKFDKI